MGDEYRDAVVNGWNGLASDALHPNGFLGYVQSTGKQPKDGQPVTYYKAPNFEDYGLGAFLLAGSEVYRLQTAAVPELTSEALIFAAAIVAATMFGAARRTRPAHFFPN
jgi:hypothetical protein